MLVLASRSPRRQQLLDMMGVPYETDPAEISEARQPNEAYLEYAVRVAREKAQDRARHHPGAWILGADTIVVIENDLLGKPDSPVDAARMLLRLSGARHDVITALALVRDGDVHTRVDSTAVWFRALTREWIDAYVETGEPLDKAGAYGIQGRGAALVERIDGDFFAVMGLSVRLLVDLMAEVGMPYNFTR
jgi:nucleoside triphosphate pyrophosphatase